MNGSISLAAGLWLSSIAAANGADAFGPLTTAAVRGDAAAVATLLDQGANPNARDWLGLTPMSAGMRSCGMTVEVLRLLIAAGGDVEARSGVAATPLMMAWQKGRDDLAQTLLAAGADPEARNMYGDTAAEYRDYFHGSLPASDFAALRHRTVVFAREPGDPPTYCPRQD